MGRSNQQQAATWNTFGDVETYITNRSIDKWAESAAQQNANNDNFWKGLQPQGLGTIANQEGGATPIFYSFDRNGKLQYYTVNSNYNKFTAPNEPQYISYNDPAKQAAAQADLETSAAAAIAKKEADAKAAADTAKAANLEEKEKVNAQQADEVAKRIANANRLHANNLGTMPVKGEGKYATSPDDFDIDYSIYTKHSNNPDAIDYRVEKSGYKNYIGNALDEASVRNFVSLDGNQPKEELDKRIDEWANNAAGKYKWADSEVGAKQNFIKDIKNNPANVDGLAASYSRELLNPPAAEPTPITIKQHTPAGATLDANGNLAPDTINNSVFNADGTINYSKVLKYDEVTGKPIVSSAGFTADDKEKILNGTAKNISIKRDPVTKEKYIALTHNGQELKLDLSSANFTDEELAKAKVSYTDIDKTGINDVKSTDSAVGLADKTGYKLDPTGKFVVDEKGNRVNTSFDAPTTGRSGDITPTTANGMLVDGTKNEFKTVADIRKINEALGNAGIDPNSINLKTVDDIRKINEALGNAGIDPNSVNLKTLEAVKNISLNAANIDKDDKRSYSLDEVKKIVADTKSVDMQVSPDSLVSNRLTGLLSQNNPYIQQARNAATLQSARRGLLNSGAAAGFAQDAAIKAAVPIAQADAMVYSDAQKANQLAQNSLIEKGMIAKANSAASDATTFSQLLTKQAELTQQVNIEKAKMEAGAIDADANRYRQSIADLAQVKVQKAALEAEAVKGDTDRYRQAVADLAQLKMKQAELEAGAVTSDATTQKDIAELNAGYSFDAAKTNKDSADKMNIQDSTLDFNTRSANAGFSNTMMGQALTEDGQTNRTNAQNETTTWNKNADRQVSVDVGNADRTLDVAKFNKTMGQNVDFKNSEDILAAFTFNKNNTRDSITKNFDALTTAMSKSVDAKNQIMRDLALIDADFLKSKNSAENSILSNMMQSHSELAKEFAVSLWKETAAMNASEREKARDVLLNEFTKDGLKITHDYEMDLAQLNNFASDKRNRDSGIMQLAGSTISNLMSNLRAIGEAEGLSQASKAAMSEAMYGVFAYVSQAYDLESLGLPEIIAPKSKGGEAKTVVSDALDAPGITWDFEDMDSTTSKAKVTALAEKLNNKTITKGDPDLKLLATVVGDQLADGKSDSFSKLITQSPDLALYLADSMNPAAATTLDFSKYDADILTDVIAEQINKSGTKRESSFLKALTSDTKNRDLALKVLNKLAGTPA